MKQSIFHSHTSSVYLILKFCSEHLHEIFRCFLCNVKDVSGRLREGPGCNHECKGPRRLGGGVKMRASSTQREETERVEVQDA